MLQIKEERRDFGRLVAGGVSSEEGTAVEADVDGVQGQWGRQRNRAGEGGSNPQRFRVEGTEGGGQWWPVEPAALAVVCSGALASCRSLVASAEGAKQRGENRGRGCWVRGERELKK